MMQDQLGIPTCFSSGERPMDDPATITRSGQSVFMSVYRTKVAGSCRLITITWCKNLLLHGLSVSIEGLVGDNQYRCKVEVKPWYFWRKQGSKSFLVDGTAIDIFWDLKTAKFNGETGPQSDYYVAIVCQDEVILLLGDQKKDAYRKTGCRPALIEPILVSSTEHIFGKKKFCTRAKFLDKGKIHDISVVCNNNGGSGFDPEMEIRIDGQLAIKVKHLQWKFRGNESIFISKVKVEVYWDVHDWLFSPGLRHALFVFKPISSSSSSSSSISTPSSPTTMSYQLDGFNGSGSFGSSLFLYAWKVE